MKEYGKISNTTAYCVETLVVGSGASGYNAADLLFKGGARDIALITEGIKAGTSRNTGSDKQTYYKLLIQLMHYGWTREQAMKLLNEASEPMWDSYKERSTYSGYGSYSNHRTYSYTQRGQRYRTKRSPYVKHVYADKSALYHAQSKMAKYSGSGKWSKYDKRPKSPYGSYVQSRLNAKGHYTYNDSRKFNTQYRRHVRLRNIYKDNYAKYGASRMAMNQNLRAYSNRSITEMYRTNQKSYYTKLKIRRVNW